MNILEILGECCTIDSPLWRGWRWLFSSKYRGDVRVLCRRRHPVRVALGVAETAVMMMAEVVALVYLCRWLAGI